MKGMDLFQLRLISTQMICLELEVDWLDCWTRDRKAASSNPGRSDRRIFISRLTWCDNSYSVSVSPPRVTAVARKRPRSFCQKCGWRVILKHTYTLDPSKSEWADYAVVQAECGNLSGNELTCNSSGNTQLQSSQLIEPLWTDRCLKSGI